MPLNKFITGLLLFVLCNLNVNAQTEDMNYEVHANIIYRFTKYINWPEDKKKGDFIIGVVANTELYNELAAFMKDRKVGNQKIVVKKMSIFSTAYNCHILFIGDDAEKEFKRIASLLQKASVLLVSESEGLAKKGSCINFIVKDDHLKLQINKSNISERNLKIASELVALSEEIR